MLTCEAKVQSDVAGYTRQSFATTAARGKESPASPERTIAPLEWAPELPAAGSHTTFNVYDSTARLKLHLSDEASLIKTIFGGTVVEIRHVGDALEVRPSVPGGGVTEEGLTHVESGEGWMACDGGEFETTLTGSAGKAAGRMVLQLQWQPEVMAAAASPAEEISRTISTPRTQAKRHSGKIEAFVIYAWSVCGQLSSGMHYRVQNQCCKTLWSISGQFLRMPLIGRRSWDPPCDAARREGSTSV